jgi:hypothetical protein
MLGGTLASSDRSSAARPRGANIAPTATAEVPTSMRRRAFIVILPSSVPVEASVCHCSRNRDRGGRPHGHLSLVLVQLKAYASDLASKRLRIQWRILPNLVFRPSIVCSPPRVFCPWLSTTLNISLGEGRVVQHGKIDRPMSEVGQQRRFRDGRATSALPPIADEPLHRS